MHNLEWNELAHLDITVLDQEHRGLVDIYRELYAAVEAKASGMVLYFLLHKLTTHAEQHFKSEDFLMALSAYPEAARHRDVHKGLLTQVAEVTRDFGDHPETLSTLLLATLREWLVAHTLAEDTPLAQWLIATKLPIPDQFPK